MKLVFKTLPPSTNHMYGRTRTGGVYLTQRARDAKEDIGWEARAQYRGKPLDVPLSVVATFYWPSLAKRDTDNDKAFFDALNGIVWEDDFQISDRAIRRRWDPMNPRIELEVEPMVLEGASSKPS